MSMKNIVEQYLKSWATRFQMIVTAKGPMLTQLQSCLNCHSLSAVEILIASVNGLNKDNSVGLSDVR